MMIYQMLDISNALIYHMSNSDPWSECLQTMHPEEKIIYIYTYICTFIYRPCYVAYGTLVPWPGIEPRPLGGSDSKESACNVGGPGSIPGSGRYPGEGNSYPLQYSFFFNFFLNLN